MDFEEIEEIVKEKLSEKRFYHSKCVVKRSIELASRYDINIQKAKLVGIVHDMAKELSEEDKIKYVEENGLQIDDIEYAHPNLLHGKIAGDMAKKMFGFSDDMVQAITFHTTGKANMSMLDKILYVADATGDDRLWEDVEYVKELANKNIDEAVMYLLNMEIKDRVEKNKVIHVNSILARNHMILNKNSKQE